MSHSYEKTMASDKENILSLDPGQIFEYQLKGQIIEDEYLFHPRNANEKSKPQKGVIIQFKDARYVINHAAKYFEINSYYESNPLIKDPRINWNGRLDSNELKIQIDQK